MKLVNMAMSKEKAAEQSPSTLAEPEMPRYAYGLRIELDDDALEKLGITGLPKVGTEMMITANVCVCAIGSSDSQEGDAESHVSLQITDMALGDEDEPKGKRSPAKALYGAGQE